MKKLVWSPAPESDKDVLKWLADHDRYLPHYINGRFVRTKKTFQTVNPATGELLARVAYAGKNEVDHAMQAAREAQMEWQDLSGFERHNFLYAIARTIKKRAREFAVAESLDNGKPIRESRDIDIPLVVRQFEYSAGWAQALPYEYPDHVPHGVVACIIPWNFPLLMAAWKIAPYIAAGNTVVLKPAEFTPLTAAMLAEVFRDVGLPPGVVNIIFGDGATGALMVNHETPNAIAFTGSTEVGGITREATAGREIHLSLELGGKSPFIVFRDADLDSVVDGVVDAIWFNQGHVCCAGSRLLVEESVHDRLILKLKRKMETLRGAKAPYFQLDKSIDIGAVIAPSQLETIDRYIQIGKDENLEMFQPENYECPAGGSFCPPTLFTNVSPSSKLAEEEIFGPVLVAMSFRTKDEAIELANNTRFGLAASVWTQRNELKNEVVSRLKAGTVWVNCTNVFDAASGFGGYRESGYGREGGREGMLETIHEEWDEPLPEEMNRVKFKTDRALIDRTYRLWIGGKLTRPDGEKSFLVHDVFDAVIAEVAEANRKDVRNAVEAASKAVETRVAPKIANRAQLLRFLAENLSKPSNQSGMIETIVSETGRSERSAEREVKESIERLCYWASMIQLYEGDSKFVASDFHVTGEVEPIGVMAIRCPDDYPLLGFVNTFAPAFGMGNGVVMVTGKHPVSALEFLQILENSDMPAGAISVLTSSDPESTLVPELAKHENVDAFWHFGTESGSELVEKLSISNMKRTWCSHGRLVDWFGDQGKSTEFLRQATQIKNIWNPIGG